MSRPSITLVTVGAAFLGAPVPLAAQRTPAGPAAPALRAMTLDEKLAFLHGAPDPEHLAGAGYVPGVPRLGIPPGDGRVGG